MRSRTPASLEGHCHRCYLQHNHCLCATLPWLSSTTEVIIVRHRDEARLTSNTGRIAQLCLSNCRIVEYGSGIPFDESRLPAQDSALLYPAVEASRVTIAPKHLIVLDSTFRQARRMFKRISTLRQIPLLSLAPPASTPHRLRVPPRSDGMSTIEAIAAGLSLVEDERLGPPLLACYAEFVRRTDAQRGRVRASTIADAERDVPSSADADHDP